jgi:predicted nuclease with RNAse H fold
MPRRSPHRATTVRGPAVGLDLAGSPLRRTGFCRLGPGLATETRVLGPDEEIVEAVRTAQPRIVAIDAPLSLPRGRRSLDIPGPPHLRLCDRALLDRGIRFFPVTLGPMRMLTRRGIELAGRLRRDGYPVIEAYPGGAQDLLGLPRKGDGVERLRRAMVRFGFTGDVQRRAITHDELDAIMCAHTGREHLAGRSVILGDPAEGTLILPRPSSSRRQPPGPVAPVRGPAPGG